MSGFSVLLFRETCNALPNTIKPNLLLKPIRATAINIKGLHLLAILLLNGLKSLRTVVARKVEVDLRDFHWNLWMNVGYVTISVDILEHSYWQLKVVWATREVLFNEFSETDYTCFRTGFILYQSLINVIKESVPSMKTGAFKTLSPSTFFWFVWFFSMSVSFRWMKIRTNSMQRFEALKILMKEEKCLAIEKQ